MSDKHVIYDTHWRFDEAGQADFVAESEWLEDASDEECYQAYVDYIYEIKGDEQANLDIDLGDKTVIAYGTQERWCGPNTGADPLGSNVNSIFDFDPGDEICYYVEDGDVWARAYDHDGATVVVFRAADPEYVEMLEDGEPIGGMEAFLDHTESIADYVCDVYGW